MKENAGFLFFLLLDRNKFSCHTLIFPTNQSKFVWCHSRVSILSSKQSSDQWECAYYPNYFIIRCLKVVKLVPATLRNILRWFSWFFENLSKLTMSAKRITFRSSKLDRPTLWNQRERVNTFEVRSHTERGVLPGNLRKKWKYWNQTFGRLCPNSLKLGDLLKSCGKKGGKKMLQFHSQLTWVCLGTFSSSGNMCSLFVLLEKKMLTSLFACFKLLS